MGEQLYNWKPRRWRLAYARGAAHICCYGDSTTAGYIAEGGRLRRDSALSWPGRLAAQLGAQGSGWIFFYEPDTRAEFRGQWDTVPYGPYSKSGKRTQGNSGAELRLVQPWQCNLLRIMYVAGPGAGVWVVRISGMPDQILDTNAASVAVRVAEFSCGALGQHTVSLLPHPAHGSCHVLGVEFVSGNCAVRVSNLGAASTVAANLAGEGSLAAAFDMLAPDLSIIAYGANSGAQAPAAYRQDLAVLIERAQRTGDVLLVTSMRWQDPGIYNVQDALDEEIRGLGVPYWDLHERWGDWSADVQSDTIHGNATGYSDYANGIRQAILTGM